MYNTDIEYSLVGRTHPKSFVLSCHSHTISDAVACSTYITSTWELPNTQDLV